MPTSETRAIRGRRRGRSLAARTVNELRTRRQVLGISQSQLASELGVGQSTIARIEAEEVDLEITRAAQMASVLGLELSIGVHEMGDPIRDKGHQALGKRFDAIPSAAWRNAAEVLLPNVGDRRSWDRVLRLTKEPGQIVGAELETRIRDIQALVRRMRDRERDGGVDEILIVLSNSATNRALVDELRTALGDRYTTAPRAILRALRLGRAVAGSGVVLL
jgi:transcriptional regulator with XRE-family HTH domain